MRALAALLLLLFAAAGCTPTYGSTNRMGILYGGADNLDIVSSPERVQAFRLRPPPADEPVPHYNQWPVVGSPVRVSRDIASRFSNGLTRSSSFPRWEDPKTCEPRPGFMLRFTADDRHVDVVFCFECKILFTYRGSESIWYANFDGSTKSIASLFLQLFPNDPVLVRLAAQDDS
ncbi:MAG TPA: hypothetical protein VKW04_06035 [Planctomycetota bacterium]|nr:hypothetical protein [Planctomycetota bacterium]